jgi:hypothetical protein
VGSGPRRTGILLLLARERAWARVFLARRPLFLAPRPRICGPLLRIPGTGSRIHGTAPRKTGDRCGAPMRLCVTRERLRCRENARISVYDTQVSRKHPVNDVVRRMPLTSAAQSEHDHDDDEYSQNTDHNQQEPHAAPPRARLWHAWHRPGARLTILC